MRSAIRWNLLMVVVAALGAMAVGQTESTLFTFTETGNFWPLGGFVEDASGNLYGATKGGGTYGAGTVYEMSPPTKSGGSWTEKTLYSFPTFGNGGYIPSSEVIMDAAGNLYGTTWAGGDSVCNCGTVYELVKPTTGGAWTETVLYNFTAVNEDGRLPNSQMTMGANGTIYGVTQQGGAYNSGTIFQLAPGTGGTYTESVLYSFGNLEDADTPNGPMVMDASGALYGVTSLGGTLGDGAVYKFVPGTNGNPGTETVLYSFGGGKSSSYGDTPVGNLVFDSAGNLYGVTNAGGNSSSDGIVYELSPATGSWTEKVLYTFNKNSGISPQGGLAWNATSSALYGTTTNQNGLTTGSGSVFQLTAPTTKGGAWTESTLFQFTYAGNGGYPTGHILVDPTSGTLYGTASQGGVRNCDLFCGVVWQIVNP